MATRNFWVDADIDGRRTRLSGGPQRKDGGMLVTIKMRDRGNIEKVVTISCDALTNGNLQLVVDVMGDTLVERSERVHVIERKR